MLKSIFFLFNSLMVLFITVRVFKPKKSNLIRPEFSAEYISNWVEGKSKLDEVSLYSGTVSINFLSAITTPAACVAKFLFKPSSFKESLISLSTLFTIGFVRNLQLNLMNI